MCIRDSTNTGLVLNQVCQLGLPAGERQLEKLSGFCRKNLLHRPLHEVALLRDDFLQRELGGDYLCLAPAVQLICRMCAELCRAKVHLEGQSNLLRYAAPEHGYNAFLELLKETDTLLRAAPKEGGNVAVLLGDDLDQELAGTTLVSTGYLFGPVLRNLVVVGRKGVCCNSGDGRSRERNGFRNC